MASAADDDAAAKTVSYRAQGAAASYYCKWIVSLLGLFGLYPLLFYVGHVLVPVDEDDEESLEANRWKYLTAVHIPAIIFVILASLASLLVSRRVSADIMEQSSKESNLKETVKSAWVNCGIVAALMLSITTGNHNEAEDKNTIAGQWFGCLMLLSTCFELAAMVLASAYVMYIEGLSDNATKKLLEELPYITGRPVLLMTTGVVCMAAAFVVSTFINYGTFTGCLFIGLFPGFIVYALLEWYWISAFKNDVDPAGQSLRYSKNDNVDPAVQNTL